MAEEVAELGNDDSKQSAQRLKNDDMTVEAQPGIGEFGSHIAGVVA